jgi:hypothetical protein
MHYCGNFVCVFLDEVHELRVYYNVVLYIRLHIAVVTSFDVLSRQLPGGAEKNYDIPEA